MAIFNVNESFNIKFWCVKIETAVKDYPKLEKFVENGKLDFGDHESLRMYNKAVAYSLAQLEIDVPRTHLIPAVCLRYAYMRLISEQYLKPDDRIIEIGTGASGIISLFGAKLFDLKVTATELDVISYETANNNFIKNSQSNNIALLKSEGGILVDVIESGSKFDALLTYPPTYSDSSQDSGKLNKKRGFKGIKSEMIGGGDDGFEFTNKLLHEACSNQYEIRFITVMCLFKSHVLPSIEIFNSYQRKTKIVELIAGTRKRYIVIGSNQ